MTNARSDVTAYGWKLYRVAHPRPDLDSLNRQLQQAGLQPVSIRTMKHYQKLERYGFDEYMPINELDIRIKLQRAG